MGFSSRKIKSAMYEDLIFYTGNVSQLTKSQNCYTNRFVL